MERNRKVVLIAFYLFPALFFLAAPDFSRAAEFVPTVYVYADQGACPEGCVTAIAAIAQRNGFRFIPVAAAALSGEIAGIKPRVGDLWVQPGGNALDAAVALGPRGMARLRNWVAGGLNYLGLCAGAFLADRMIDDENRMGGLGLIPFPTYDFLPGRHEAMVLEVRWANRPRWLYFQDGAAFPVGLPPSVSKIAHYSDGRPSVIQTIFGKGRVVLSGVHPEAPQEWLESDGLEDPDGNDGRLADELLLRALGY